MSSLQVLIETYWNVKVLLHSQTYRHLLVLIETYWNVKIFTSGLDIAPYSTNRNILECKDRRRRRENGITERINRNILECKEYLPSCQKALQICINRNILECKDSMKIGG